MRKKVFWQDNVLFASKAKINEWRAPKETTLSEEFIFQKLLILAFEALAHCVVAADSNDHFSYFILFFPSPIFK